MKYICREYKEGRCGNIWCEYSSEVSVTDRIPGKPFYYCLAPTAEAMIVPVDQPEPDPVVEDEVKRFGDVIIHNPFDGTKAQVGDKVWSTQYGWEEIVGTDNSLIYPIATPKDGWTIDGMFKEDDILPSLFNSPPEIFCKPKVEQPKVEPKPVRVKSKRDIHIAMWMKGSEMDDCVGSPFSRKKQWLDALGIPDGERPQALCYACAEAAHNNNNTGGICINCPIDWGKEVSVRVFAGWPYCECVGTLYNKWIRSTDPEEARALCVLIAKAWKENL